MEWDTEALQSAVASFREQHIDADIIASELSEDSMGAYVRLLHRWGPSGGVRGTNGGELFYEASKFSFIWESNQSPNVWGRQKTSQPGMGNPSITQFFKVLVFRNC